MSVPVPVEIADLVEFLSSREWRRINYGDGPAWQADGVEVTVDNSDPDYPDVEVWTIEVEVGPGRAVVDVDLLGAVDPE